MLSLFGASQIGYEVPIIIFGTIGSILCLVQAIDLLVAGIKHHQFVGLSATAWTMIFVCDALFGVWGLTYIILACGATTPQALESLGVVNTSHLTPSQLAQAKQIAINIGLINGLAIFVADVICAFCVIFFVLMKLQYDKTGVLNYKKIWVIFSYFLVSYIVFTIANILGEYYMHSPNDTEVWLSILSWTASIVAFVAVVPLTLKVFKTKGTVSYPWTVEFSGLGLYIAFVLMGVFLTTQAIHNNWGGGGIASGCAEIVFDGFNLCLTLAVMMLKIYIVRKAKSLNLTEAQYCAQLQVNKK